MKCTEFGDENMDNIKELEEYINWCWAKHRLMRVEEGEYELAERYRGEVVGAMHALNTFGYIVSREDDGEFKIIKACDAE